MAATSPPSCVCVRAGKVHRRTLRSSLIIFSSIGHLAHPWLRYFIKTTRVERYLTCFTNSLKWHREYSCQLSINPMINKYPFALLAAVAVDISVDALHGLKGHVEEFCVQLLDSRTRELPERSNTESSEQQWVDLVRMTRLPNYMNRGMHEFWKLTHYVLKNPGGNLK